jgi:hypothetical protein
LEQIDLKDVIEKHSFVDSKELHNKITKSNEEYWGLYLFTSYFNHSCTANIYNYFINDYIICEAICDIQKGEELCVTYVKRENRQYRKLKLSPKGFVCTCSLCSSEEDLIDKILKKLEELSNFFQQNYSDPSKVTSVLNDLLSSFQKYRAENYLVIIDSIYNKLFDIFSGYDFIFNASQRVIRDKIFIELFKSKILTFNYENFINEMLYYAITQNFPSFKKELTILKKSYIKNKSEFRQKYDSTFMSYSNSQVDMYFMRND